MKDTDRELLELAAKAAGVDCEWLDGWRGPVIGRGMASRCWLPLEDDGDAFRLAVKLRLNVIFEEFDGVEYACAVPSKSHQGQDDVIRDDELAATRRAIVRAAAAICKEMP